MKRKFTCIVCPNGCEIETEYEGATVISITGNLCKKGEEYVTQELIDPRRTIASSVCVRNGELPVTSVRLTVPIPKKNIFDVMEVINQIVLEAPVHIGDIACADILGLGSDVIVTKNVDHA